MPRQIITTTNAPGSPLYSQGVKAGPYVLVSGIVGIDVEVPGLLVSIRMTAFIT